MPLPVTAHTAANRNESSAHNASFTAKPFPHCRAVCAAAGSENAPTNTERKLTQMKPERQQNGVWYDEPSQTFVKPAPAQPQHTPGPWSEHDGQIYAENDPKGRTFALIPYYDREPEQDANARLIAAAPELLAALRWVIGDDSSDEPCIVAARAAIAKAEGSAR